MHRANRVILWGALLTVPLVAACLAFPFLALQAEVGKPAGEVITAASLMAAYLILVVGILAVGANTYGNLAFRRADAALDTRRNRQYFNGGIVFCVAGLAFIFFPLL